MDQKFVSGLGNIYVNEILFYSCIKPNRKVKKLNDTDIRKIITNTKKILKSAIDRGGSSIRDFSSENGKKGSFQEHLKVYGRIGLSCSNSDCKKIIKKMVISNRSTFYCPSCQKY
jgi:Formamidopyrimidine-DNA glycosylase